MVLGRFGRSCIQVRHVRLGVEVYGAGLETLALPDACRALDLPAEKEEACKRGCSPPSATCLRRRSPLPPSLSAPGWTEGQIRGT